MAGRLRPEGLPDSSLLLGLLCSLQRKDHEATSPMGPGKGCRARPWWACMLPSPWLLRPVGPWASFLLPRHPRGHSHPCPPVPRSHRAFPKAPATPLSPCAPDISSPACLTSSPPLRFQCWACVSGSLLSPQNLEHCLTHGMSPVPPGWCPE